MRKLTAKITPQGSYDSLLIHHNVVNVDIGALERGTVSDTTNWGIFANTGTLVFIDHNQDFAKMIETFDIYNAKVEIYMSNDFYDKLIATMLLSDYAYDQNTKNVEIELIDAILEWQQIPFARIFYFERTTANILLRKIFTEQLGVDEKGYLSYLENEASITLENVKIHCADLEADSIWSAITQICELAMLRVYSDENGKPRFSAVDELEGISGTPIIIRSRNILTKPNVILPHNTKVANPDLKLTDRIKFTNKRLDLITFKLNSLVAYDSVPTWEPVSPDAPENLEVSVKKQETTAENTTTISATISGRLELPQRTFDYSDPIIRLNKSSITYDTVNYKTSLNNSSVGTDLTGNNKYTPSNITNTVSDDGINIEFTENESVSADFSNGAKISFYTEGSIELKGDYYEDRLDNSQSVEGDFQLSANSLMQKYNTYGIKDYKEWYLDKVKKLFGNGIICCEIECGVSKYWDSQGTLVKDPDNPTPSAGMTQIFSKYEIVVPYITIGGGEVPLATDSDGQPIKFKIIGIKYHYVGLIRQTLYLQEYVLSN